MGFAYRSRSSYKVRCEKNIRLNWQKKLLVLLRGVPVLRALKKAGGGGSIPSLACLRLYPAILESGFASKEVGELDA